MTRRLIGIGNPDRGDDAAGWEVASRVTSWATTLATTGTFGLIDTWDPADDVVIVDAMRSGMKPGTTVRFDGVRDTLPSGAFTSTHSFGPPEIVGLAKSLDRMPHTMTVIGIEIDCVEHGAQLSESVAEAITALTRELEDA